MSYNNFKENNVVYDFVELGEGFMIYNIGRGIYLFLL